MEGLARSRDRVRWEIRKDGVYEPHRFSQEEQMRPVGHPWTFLKAEETGCAVWKSKVPRGRNHC